MKLISRAIKQAAGHVIRRAVMASILTTVLLVSSFPSFAGVELSTGALQVDPAINRALSRITLPLSAFSDVSVGDWAYEDIRKLADAHIISGETYDKGTEGARRAMFRPDAELTREECAALISNLLSAISGADMIPFDGEPTYVDVKSSSWSYQYIENTKQYLNDYVTRDGGRFFYPHLPITRGDFITALMKLSDADVSLTDYSFLDPFTDVSGEGKQWRAYAAVALGKNILKGYDDNTLRLSGKITRREICALTTRALAGIYEFPETERVKQYIPDLASGFYDTFYDDAVFVGDSISMGLRNHVLNQRSRGAFPLGNAKFLVAGSYGIRAAAGDFNPGGVNLSYQGVAATLEDCVARLGTKDVYLMLGMNDWAGASLPDSIEKYEIIVDKVYSRISDANIRIQLCTPVTKSREREKLNNANTDKFNAAIIDLCERRGIDYIDVSTPMKDDQNAFKAEFASDGYVHMSAAGCESWINTLREYALEKYLSGGWTPAEGNPIPESYSGAWY